MFRKAVMLLLSFVLLASSTFVLAQRPAIPKEAARARYIASAEKFARVTRQVSADVELSNHPFVIRREACNRDANIISECTKAVTARGPTAS